MKIDKTSGVYKACMLGILCAVCGILLSTVNAITAPIIEENALASVKSSLEIIYPGATFTDVTEDKIGLLELKDGEDTLIDGIYNAEGKGTIFTLHSTGYNADGFKFMIAYNNDGSVGGYSVLEQAETAGKGDKAFKDPYVSDVLKLTSSDTMPLITGATITTTAVGKAVDQARQVFNKMNNISYDENATATPAPKAEPVELAKEDFKDNKAECSETSNNGTIAVYACKAHGFEGVNEATV
ncbi:FMN-binding protein, partial [Solobacterium moorei]